MKQVLIFATLLLSSDLHSQSYVQEMLGENKTIIISKPSNYGVKSKKWEFGKASKASILVKGSELISARGHCRVDNKIYSWIILYIDDSPKMCELQIWSSVEGSKLGEGMETLIKVKSFEYGEKETLNAIELKQLNSLISKKQRGQSYNLE